MRILAIAPTGFFADYGCHVRIMGQLQALQARGYRIHLATYPAGRDLPGLDITRAPLPFARTIPVGSSRRKLLLDGLLAPTALAAALRFQPDIIHCYLHEGALIAWIIARLLRVPLTCDYQGSLTAEMIDHHFLSPRSPFLPPLRRLEAWIERRPDALFPSSHHAADRLRRRSVPPDRIHTLPDSVDPDLFHPQPKDPALLTRLGLDPARPIVLYLGLLAPYQGTDLLLNAIASPPLAGHPAQFLIMGFPHVARYTQLARQLGVAERVRFTGAIPYTQAPTYLALGDLALAPKLSTTEGSGKLLPYMSMALPIVATDTPVHRQYLAGDGLLVEPTEPEVFAEEIVRTLAELPIWRKKAAQLRRRVQNQYTWQQAAASMAAIFERLADA